MVVPLEVTAPCVHTCMYDLYTQIRIKYLFFSLKQIAFPLKGDRFAGCFCAAASPILITIPFLPALFMAGGGESSSSFEPEQGLCLVALITEWSSSSKVAFPKVSHSRCG